MTARQLKQSPILCLIIACCSSIGFADTPVTTTLDGFVSDGIGGQPVIESNSPFFSASHVFSTAPCGSCNGNDPNCESCGCNSGSPKGCASQAKPDPCATSHKNLFYNNDFSYLRDPCYNGCCLGDRFKHMPVGQCGRFGTLDVGGQLRLRYHHERGMAQNAGFTRFQDNTNDLLLTRVRLYSDWQVNENIRFYAERIYSGLAADDDYVPRAIDENYGDLNNLFVDLKVNDNTTVRIGRQELLYGSQRTVSTLDWANTRRTFEGINVLYDCGDWSIDSFYTNFVPVDPNDFDEANYDQSFYGMYSVYQGLQDATLDLYYLGYDNQTAGAPIATDFSLHTFGARLNGSYCEWLYEFEGAPQFGRQSGLGLDHSGGFFTAGLGRKVKSMPWSTTVWLYYDYASGNNIGGDFNRNNQLFPLAHKYLGFIDATQRANIESPNLLVTMKPTKKTSLLLWYYHMMSNQDTDVVPSIGGTPAQSTASKDWGDEIDIVARYAISPRSNILFGWSHFWAGNKIVTANQADADFFYTQFSVNF